MSWSEQTHIQLNWLNKFEHRLEQDRKDVRWTAEARETGQGSALEEENTQDWGWTSRFIEVNEHSFVVVNFNAITFLHPQGNWIMWELRLTASLSEPLMRRDHNVTKVQETKLEQRTIHAQEGRSLLFQVCKWLSFQFMDCNLGPWCIDCLHTFTGLRPTFQIMLIFHIYSDRIESNDWVLCNRPPAWLDKLRSCSDSFFALFLQI